jgi:hypothetical protein
MDERTRSAVVVIALMLAGAFFCFVMVYVEGGQQTPCSSYADVRIKNVPARCIAYFEEGSR